MCLLPVNNQDLLVILVSGVPYPQLSIVRFFGPVRDSSRYFHAPHICVTPSAQSSLQRRKNQTRQHNLAPSSSQSPRSSRTRALLFVASALWRRLAQHTVLLVQLHDVPAHGKYLSTPPCPAASARGSCHSMGVRKGSAAAGEGGRR